MTGTTSDIELMDEAIRASSRGLGRTSPNPVVGAVIVKAGKVLAVAHHAKAGAPHAEVVVLQKAGRQARGSTLYVTLEPCNHVGRTPPCTEAILAAGVRRVVVATRDPNPHVTGGGIRRLRAAGVRVDLGVNRVAAEHVNRAWLHYITLGLPYVTLKVAITADGCLATKSGDSRWISSEPARAQVHRLRDQVDAVLVGAGTVRADDPRLTARGPGGRSPLRVILDGRLRTPRRANVYRPGHLVFTAVKPGRGDRRRIEVLPGKNGRLPLRLALRRLAELDVVHLLVEGGAEVLTEFIEQELWDELRLFVAPKLAGPEGIRWFQGRSAKRMRDAFDLGGFGLLLGAAPDASLIVERAGRQPV
jgi:diaminohydroxyphosphoribosylaminopyrimidine deaminase/5-amino-6-(5-phosphoribosylamino)uracil reductase